MQQYPVGASHNAEIKPGVFYVAGVATSLEMGYNNNVPTRWTREEVDALGNDKGFLPEAYWPGDY